MNTLRNYSGRNAITRLMDEFCKPSSSASELLVALDEISCELNFEPKDSRTMLYAQRLADVARELVESYSETGFPEEMEWQITYALAEFKRSYPDAADLNDMWEKKYGDKDFFSEEQRKQRVDFFTARHQHWLEWKKRRKFQAVSRSVTHTSRKVPIVSFPLLHRDWQRINHKARAALLSEVWDEFELDLSLPQKINASVSFPKEPEGLPPRTPQEEEAVEKFKQSKGQIFPDLTHTRRPDIRNLCLLQSFTECTAGPETTKFRASLQASQDAAKVEGDLIDRLALALRGDILRIGLLESNLRFMTTMHNLYETTQYVCQQQMLLAKQIQTWTSHVINARKLTYYEHLVSAIKETV